MARTNNNPPGIPDPKLPVWLDSTSTLSQNFLSKKVRPPFTGGQPWLGERPTPAIGGGFAPLTAANPGYGYSSRVTNPPQPAGTRLGGTDFSAKKPLINWKQLGDAGMDLAPFASNIVNAFRTVPQPLPPNQVSPITLNRVNNDAELANIDSQTRAMDIAADRGLDGNGAAAVRSGNLATKLRAYGDSYSRTANQNAQIGNQQNMFNASIDDRNARTRDQYNDELTGAKIAQQRASSENISNAADKFISLQDAKARRDLDERKWRDASRLFNKGVTERFDDYLDNPAYESQKLQDAKDKEDETYRKARNKKAFGGSLSRLKKAY